MRRFIAPLWSTFLPLILLAAPALADEVVYETVETVVVPAGGDRYVAATAAPEIPQGVAAYGPFRVLDAGHAALVDVTDAASPAQFAALLHDHPGVATLELVECPGTDDDRANLALGRMIHSRGISTHVPAGGSVRSGGVELFLAGAKRSADARAEFAVHSWEDENGREPSDFAPDAPENRIYLDYYRDMGLTADEARAFYAMTNSVTFDNAKWLTTADLAHYVRLDNS